MLGTAGSSPFGGFEIAEVIMWLVLQRPVGQSRISSAAGLAGDDPLWRHLLYVREGGGGHRRSSAVVGVSNPHVCAVMRWGSLDDFLKTRNTQVLNSVPGPIPTARPATPRPGPSM